MNEQKVTFYREAGWATVSGEFTAEELRKIADKIDNPNKRTKLDGDEGYVPTEVKDNGSTN